MSNRAERRRRDRDRAKGRVTVPDGTLLRAHVLQGTGEVAEVTNYRDLPTKRPYAHRWIVTVVHSLGQEQAEAWAEGGGQVRLDPSTIVDALMGCMDCEQTFDQAKGKPCTVADTGWDR